MTYRHATPTDAPTIAALHALSWQNTYRGAFSDQYLDHEAPTERLQVWTERFAEDNTKVQVIVAEMDGQLAGFSCVFSDHSPTDGHLLDNLHVHPDYKGQGIGKDLIQLSAKRLLEDKKEGDIFLWVLTTNTAGIGFYKHLGGSFGRSEIHHLPGDMVAPALMISWPLIEVTNWNLPPA